MLFASGWEKEIWCSSQGGLSTHFFNNLPQTKKVSLTQAASTAIINKTGANSATGTASLHYAAPACNQKCSV